MARSEKLYGVNKTRLSFAREYYGLSLDDVHNKTKISLENIAGFENGEKNPSYTELSALAKIYNRPLLYFFFPEAPHIDTLQAAFRHVEEENGQLLNFQGRVMMEKAYEYRMNLEELFHDDNPPVFHKLLKETQTKDERSLAVFLRNKLNLSLERQKDEFCHANDLLEYLRDRLYSIGIYVFKDSFRSDDISGLCLYDDYYPVILLNNKTSFTRQLFTVFHEIYHLWNQEVDVYIPKRNEEKKCDKFAGEFLVPSDDFIISLQLIVDYERQDFISELASKYKVSPEAIAYRLKSMGKISPGFYSTIREDGIRRVSAKSSGGNFYYTRMSYLGKPYLKQVYNQYYNGKISTKAVGKYTGLKTAYVTKLSSNIFGGAL